MNERSERIVKEKFSRGLFVHIREIVSISIAKVCTHGEPSSSQCRNAMNSLGEAVFELVVGFSQP